MGITFKHGSANAAFGSVVTNSATLSTVAGNLLVVVGYDSASTGTIGIGDTNGETWTPLTPINGTADTVQAWYVLSSKGGSNTVTVTSSVTGSLSRGILFAEWTVSGGTVSFDKQGIRSQAPVTNPSSPTVTTTKAIEILVGYFISNITNTFTASGGDTVELVTSGQLTGALTDQGVSSIGSYNQAVTTSSATIVSGIATFGFTASALGGSWLSGLREFINKRGVR